MSDKNIGSEEVVESIKNYPLNIEKINSVYIFGSFGTDDFNGDSDIDIAILPKDKIACSEILALNSELEDMIKINLARLNVTLNK